MASPETSNRGFGEKLGYTARNVGAVLSVIGLFVPALLVPSIGLVASGELLRRISDDD